MERRGCARARFAGRLLPRGVSLCGGESLCAGENDGSPPGLRQGARGYPGSARAGGGLRLDEALPRLPDLLRRRRHRRQEVPHRRRPQDAAQVRAFFAGCGRDFSSRHTDLADSGGLRGHRPAGAAESAGGWQVYHAGRPQVEQIGCVAHRGSSAAQGIALCALGFDPARMAESVGERHQTTEICDLRRAGGLPASRSRGC
mmetsp:Transcript_82648/g.207974  ORF Transcript_82648/g.207974 Transcript_82648/m.207974 type:complete len:201 (+) Transcript_82648:635-1237(+)